VSEGNARDPQQVVGRVVRKPRRSGGKPIIRVVLRIASDGSIGYRGQMDPSGVEYRTLLSNGRWSTTRHCTFSSWSNWARGAEIVSKEEQERKGW
jgi:hypothetical protein